MSCTVSSLKSIAYDGSMGGVICEAAAGTGHSVIMRNMKKRKKGNKRMGLFSLMYQIVDFCNFDMFNINIFQNQYKNGINVVPFRNLSFWNFLFYLVLINSFFRHLKKIQGMIVGFFIPVSSLKVFGHSIHSERGRIYLGDQYKLFRITPLSYHDYSVSGSSRQQCSGIPLST